MKVYVILSDYFPALDDESTECGVFEGVYPTKDMAMDRLMLMMDVARTYNTDLVFNRCDDKLAKKIKDAVVAYGAHTDNADQYLYIRECDLEEVD